MKNIRRIDTGKTHGWQFHAMRAGKWYTKLFSDNKYNGDIGALRAAKRYRTKMLKLHPKPDSSQKDCLSKRNTTGTVGVSWYRRSYTGVLIGVQAQITIKGKRVNRKFHTVDYGKIEDAIDAASNWRAAQRASEAA